MRHSTPLRIGLAIAFLVCLSAIPAHAQYPGYLSNSNDTGMPNYGSFISSSIDTVNLDNRGLMLHIPLLSRKGRGMDYNLYTEYQSKFWVMDTSVVQTPYPQYTTYYSWRPDASTGLWAIKTNIGSSVDFNETTYTIDCGTYTPDYRDIYVLSNWVYITPDGSKHQVPLRKTLNGTAPGWCASAFAAQQLVAHTDNGHVQVDITNFDGSDYSGITIVRQDGTQEGFSSFLQKDTNGNYCCSTSSGWITDSLGRPVYTAHTTSTSNQMAYDYYDSGGTARSILVDYVSLSVSTSFPTTGYDTYHVVHQFSGTISNVISKITLPNGLAYTFSYDDPINPGHTNPYGELTKITLPTGGYVKYKWATVGGLDVGPPDPQDPGLMESIDGRVLVEKDVSEDGSIEKVWTYTVSGLSNVVTDPIGNTEVHWNYGILDCGTSPGNAPPPQLEKGVEYHDASGHLMKKVMNDWACDTGPVFSPPPGDTPTTNTRYVQGFRDPRMIRQTTTLPDTNQVTKVETDYGDSYTYTIFGDSKTDHRLNPTQIREYDFGNGSPGSLVRYTTFTYLHNSSSTYLNAHIRDRVSQKSVYDASNNLMASTQYTYDSTTITGTSSVPKHDYTNYSTSNAVRGNPTVIARWLNTSSSWLNTTNYYNDVGNLVQTTDPGGHSYTLSYADNFTDGTNRASQAFLTSVTGPTTNSVNHIEGKQYYWYTGLTAAVCGQNAPSPASCVNTYSPSSSSPVSDYAKYTYDALGRPYTVTHGDGGTTSFSFTEPSSPSPSSRISVSSTSAIDASQNLTNTAVIDGLGRVFQTQLTSDPDGTDYVDTVYDEVGRVSTGSNPHRSSSAPTDGITTNVYDGIGRTVKVIPPDGSSSANNVQTYYHGNTITAVDQTGKARRSVTDALGRLIEVDEPAAGYALPGISATAGTGTVTVTGAEQTKGHNEITGYNCTAYDDNGNCLHWEPVYTWVVDAYDSGTVSITVNGHTDTISYNQSTNTSSSAVASALNSAINADSSAYVTSSISGSVLTLTAKTTGSGTDYTLGGGSTYDTADFTHPSFYVSPSTSTLITGADAVPSFPPSESTTTPYVTLYFYDVLNNLLCVEQHGNATGQTGCSSSSTNDATSSWRIRRFTYDSLGQMLTSKNPESGTSTFTYDSDSNVLTIVSPAPNQTGSSTVTTTFTYDALHRALTKTFSDSTPSVTIAYDGTTISGCSPTLTITNGTGRRTAMCDAAGWESWAYDARSQIVTERRNTNSVTKSTSYTHNFHGGVTSITYPSGRTVSYTYNAAGQTGSASDVTNSITFASNAHYAPPGELTSLQESGSNLISTFYYNNRLQPCRISVKSSGTAPTSCTDSTNIGNVMDFTYSFTSSSVNNGNVVSITNNRNTDRTQSFTYDELNRISTAHSQATSGTYSWGLSFGYDAWANLLSASVTQGSAPALSIGVNNKNQINNTGFAFDSAGNMTGDGTNSYTFNAEGELITAAGITYTYDGGGHRVKKSNGKLYWYGNGNDPLAESDASGTFTNEFVFVDGKRIAMIVVSSSAVNYYLQDHLGSSRVVTNSSGTALDDSDFYPFGGERSYTSSSGNNYKFTGKERDAESSLDDFAARFYASNYGRFISADDSKYVNAADPQTWNLYGYVANNPINAVDPTGHAPQGDAFHPEPKHYEGGSAQDICGVGGVPSGETNSGSNQAGSPATGSGSGAAFDAKQLTSDSQTTPTSNSGQATLTVSEVVAPPSQVNGGVVTIQDSTQLRVSLTSTKPFPSGDLTITATFGFDQDKKMKGQMLFASTVEVVDSNIVNGSPDDPKITPIKRNADTIKVKLMAYTKNGDFGGTGPGHIVFKVEDSNGHQQTVRMDVFIKSKVLPPQVDPHNNPLNNKSHPSVLAGDWESKAVAHIK